MSVKKDLIIFLVSFLSHSYNIYILRQGLEYAVQDMIENCDLGKQEQEELLRILRESPNSLLDDKNKYFGIMKYAILPFLRR